MTNKTQNVFKYISLISLLAGIAIWVWYIIVILILGGIPYGEILLTVPVGTIGIISAIIAKNKKLITLNTIQTIAFPIVFIISSYLAAVELRNR